MDTYGVQTKVFPHNSVTPKSLVLPHYETISHLDRHIAGMMRPTVRDTSD